MRWKRILFWTVGGAFLLIFMALGAGLLFVRTQAFHRYVLAQLVQRGEAATGGHLQIQNFDFRLSPLTADVYGVTVRGTEPATAPPLLQVQKITVGVTIQSFLQRKFTLRELLVDHPVVNLVVDANGQTNLPQPAPSQGGSTSIFDLAVAHAQMNGGEVFCNDRKSDINGDLYDLASEIHFQPATTRYVGSLSYDRGTLRYANYSPLPHALRAQFSASPATLSLDQVRVTVGASRLALRATIENYSAPVVNANYDILIHTQDFASLSPAASPSGDLSLAGTLQYQSRPGRPFLRAVTANGELSSAQLHVSSPQGNADIRDIRAHYRLADGSLSAHTIVANLLNGRVVADLDLTQLDANADGKFQAKVEAISLAAARQSIRDPQVRRAPLTGTVSGAVKGSWKTSLSNLQALSDFTVHAAILNQSAKPQQSIPLDGIVHLDYRASNNAFIFRDTSLRLPSASIKLQGELSDRSHLQVLASSGDLSQLTALAVVLQRSGTAPERSPFSINGSATLNAIVQGPMQNPQISGQLEGRNLQVQQSQWRSVRTGFSASPSQIRLQNLSLVNARQGTLTGAVQISLHNWSYNSSSPIVANIAARQLSIVDLQRLADLNYPLEGNLSADLAFHGSQLAPAGSGSIRISKARAYDEPIQTVQADFRAANGTVSSTLNVALPAGAVNGKFTYTPKTKAYQAVLDAPAIVLQRIHAVQERNLGVAGTLTISAKGAGDLDNPQLTALIQIPELKAQDKTISHVRADVNVSNQRANLVLASDIVDASIRGNATVDLKGNHYAEATVDTGKIQLAPLLALYAPTLPQGFQGETELHATLKGPLQDKTRIEVHVTIPTFAANYQTLQFASSAPIRLDIQDSVAVLQPASITGTGTNLQFQGRIPLNGSNQITAEAHGSVNLRLIQIFDPDIKSSGAIALDVRASGSSTAPGVQGQIRLQNVALATTDAPVGLSKVNGTLDVTDNKIQISSLSGEMGGGQLSAQGSIAYRPAVQFNVTLQGQSVRLLYPDGVRTMLDSNLALVGNAQAANLTGRVLINSLSFTPDFDLSTFSSQFDNNSVPSSGQGLADNIKLDIAVQSAQNLQAVSSTVSMEGQANLRVIGTASNPVIVGRTDLTSGEIFFLNNRYKLERGIITFNNPDHTEPILNVRASTTVEQYNLTLALMGPIDKLRTSYSSDPPLATADIINLIARGQTTEEASATSPSADSILAGQVASQFSNKVSKLAGISSLQIDPLIGGNNTNPSARVALQQRVTKNFLFTFSTDVTQPEAEIVEGDYQINKRWSVSVTRDQAGGVSVDGKYHTKF